MPTPTRLNLLIPLLALLCLLHRSFSTLAQTTSATNLTARSLDQDGHDFVGPSPALAPSGIQDIHFSLAGLPQNTTITSVSVSASGGGLWLENLPGSSWRAHLVPSTTDTTRADLFLEPARAESGALYTITLTLQNGRTLVTSAKTGKIDPALRTPAASLQTRWLGQDGHDLTSATPAVGPDGLVDARIHLSGLTPNTPHVSLNLTTSTTKNPFAWAAGQNPGLFANAEISRPNINDTTATLSFQPTTNLADSTLNLAITYANGATDRASLRAGGTNPALRMPPPPSVPMIPASLDVRWLGQDGTGPNPGDIHLLLAGLPADPPIAALFLSDPVANWSHISDHTTTNTTNIYREPLSRPLHFQNSPTGAHLHFAPARDETGNNLTLRVHFADGRFAFTTFLGLKADPARNAPAPSSSPATIAKPGDDLHSLTALGGSLTLSPGTYNLEKPLRLPLPIILQAANVTNPGAVTLSFRQSPTDEPWTSAIKVHAGNTTLRGFSVRFPNPIRWNHEVAYGPAVIAATDNLDPPDAVNPYPIAGIVLENLNLQSPPPSRPGTHEEAIRLIRLMSATSGLIQGNTFSGGLIELAGGPWAIQRNLHNGTPAGTTSPAVLAVHDPHDLLVADNRTTITPNGGKTWRFLVLTGRGFNNQIRNNRIEGIGPRDNDTLPSANAPETILTESYRLHFEGRPAALSKDGRILQIPQPQGDPAPTGAIVAILEGPKAGSWSRVAQTINPTTYLLDPPLDLPPQDTTSDNIAMKPPANLPAISLASGFVNLTISGNLIDTSGSSVAAPLVIMGNQVGTRITDNHTLGGGHAFKIGACPTESPVAWGWSRNPFLDGRIERNRFENALRGGLLLVEQGPAMKSSAGRLYLSTTFRDNVAAWSLRQPPGSPAFFLGDPSATDPTQMSLSLAGNLTDGHPGQPKGALVLVSAVTLNGRPVRNQTYSLPAKSTATTPADSR